MSKITEIRNDHTCDDNLTHIDVWLTDDNSEEGKTVAVVCQDTGKVIFFDNAYRLNEQVLAAIKEVTAKDYHKDVYARQWLKERGYYTDSLWCIEDAQMKFKCTDEEAHILIGQALENDATMEQIWFAMDFHGMDNGLTKIGE